MKSIDFSQTGGFPFDQNQLNYLQTAWTEAAQALAQMHLDGAIAGIVSGCVITGGVTPGVMTKNITAGWIVYNDQLIRVVAGSVTYNSTVNALYMQISTSCTGVPFNSGGVKNVLNDVTATMVSMPIGTADTGTLVSVAELVPAIGTTLDALTSSVQSLQDQVDAIEGEIAIGAWQNVPFINTPDGQWSAVTVAQYCLHGNGYLEFRGSINNTNTWGGAYNIAQMPVGYVPKYDTQRPCSINIGGADKFITLEMTAAGVMRFAVPPALAGNNPVSLDGFGYWTV